MPGRCRDVNLFGVWAWICCNAVRPQVFKILSVVLFPDLASGICPCSWKFPLSFLCWMTVIIVKSSKIVNLHPKKQACYKLPWSQFYSVCYRPCKCICSTGGAIKILVTAATHRGGDDGKEQEGSRLGQMQTSAGGCPRTASHWKSTQLQGILYSQVWLPDSLSSQNRWKTTIRHPRN